VRAVRVNQFTDYANLEVEEIAALGPPGPGEVRFDVHATGVSFSQSLVVSGRYQRRPPLPFTPGPEAAGVVTAVGAGVTRVSPGDRIVAILDWGAWAEAAMARDVNVFPLPDGISFEEAIPFASSYPTSYVSLIWPHGLEITEGDVLLVHGAAGGVGLAAVEIGKALGATVIATVGSAGKVRVPKDHGADHVLDNSKGEFREAVLDLTDGRGADKIYDPIGGDVFDQSLRCIATEGRIVPIGFASGRIPQIPANILLLKNIAVCGVNYGYYVGWSPVDVRDREAERVREMMTQLFDWTIGGDIRPEISHRFSLAGFREAMATVLARKSIGRVVLMPQEETVDGH